MSRPGSWIVTCLSTGTVWEIFEQKDYDDAVKCSSVMIEPIGEYLGRINQEIKDLK